MEWTEPLVLAALLFQRDIGANDVDDIMLRLDRLGVETGRGLLATTRDSFPNVFQLLYLFTRRHSAIADLLRQGIHKSTFPLAHTRLAVFAVGEHLRVFV